MIRTDGAAGTARGSPVTVTRVLMHDFFFSGHRDGSVRGYALESSGARPIVFRPPDKEDESLSRGAAPMASTRLQDNLGPVVGLAIFGPGDRPVLAAAHDNGIIHTYAATDG